MVTIASQTYTGVQGGDRLEVDAGNHAVAYKGLRVTASHVGATATRCSQVEFRLKNQSRGFLRDVPKQLSMACMILTKYLYTKSTTGSIGMQSAIERRGTSFRSPGAMPNEVVQMLGRYYKVLMR